MARPLNLLWITLEDVSPWFGCHGDPLARTPFLDSLAERGTLFERCYATCPVCSPSRSSLVTGAWPSRLGVQHHRSSRTARDPVLLPVGLPTLPERLRAAGYLSFNFGKDDYNFHYDREHLYPGPYLSRFHWKESVGEPDWGAIAAMAPFFGQIQLKGGKRAEEAAVRALGPDPARVRLPGYYPDEPVFREPIANHHACIAQVDLEVREVFRRLEAHGLLGDTVVFVFADHGWDGLREKQFCYEGGTHVPLLVVGPGEAGLEAGRRRPELVSALDIAATTLALAGVDDGVPCDGLDLRDRSRTRDHVVSQRDRCDYTLDCIRGVVSERHRYVANLMPGRPWLQPQYRSDLPEFRRWRELASASRGDDPRLRFARDERPAEELYDLRADPDQLVNLAGDPAHAAELDRHRRWLARWRSEVGDPGPVFPEEQLLAVLLRWGPAACDHPAYAPVLARHADLVRRHPAWARVPRG